MNLKRELMLEEPIRKQRMRDVQMEDLNHTLAMLPIAMQTKGPEQRTSEE